MADDDFGYMDEHVIIADKPVELVCPFRFKLKDGAVDDDGEPIQFSPQPVLLVLPATTDNRQYTNAKNQRPRPKITKAAQYTEDFKEELRAIDRELYPLYVVTGWVEGTVLSGDGKIVLPSRAAVQSFIGKLNKHWFDQVRDFCSNANNFLKVDIEALAKN